MRSLAWTLLVAGCAAGAGGYVYWPQDGTYWTDGYPAALARVPRDRPTGTVETTSFGIVELVPDGGARTPALHVRLVIANNLDAMPWIVSARDQRLALPGLEAVAPIAVNSDIALPSLTIGRHEQHQIDLYFALPSRLASEDDLHAFDLLWAVTTPGQRVASRTHFARLDEEPPPMQQIARPAGWGTVWWPGHMTITRAPTWHYRATAAQRR